VFLILAMARPVWGISEEVVTVDGSEIIVVLDVSASMDAQDIAPSRLDRAKLDAYALFQNSQDNLLGLILFAGDAFVQLPLTTDVESALMFLNAASSGSVTRQGTALDEALRLAINSFDDRVMAQATIILMTDGENHENSPLQISEEAARRGIVIHAVGYGTPDGAPVPQRDTSGEMTGFKTDNAGNVIVTRLDESVLQQISEITGGLYQRAEASGIAIVNILNEIAKVKSQVAYSGRQAHPAERFSVFVLLAVIALTVEIWLPDTKLGDERS
jgi:Ca-activated chloride channel family protein